MEERHAVTACAAITFRKSGAAVGNHRALVCETVNTGASPRCHNDRAAVGLNRHLIMSRVNTISHAVTFHFTTTGNSLLQSVLVSSILSHFE